MCVCLSERDRQTERDRGNREPDKDRERQAGKQADFYKGESLYLKESSLALQFLCPIYNSVYRIYWMH